MPKWLGILVQISSVVLIAAGCAALETGSTRAGPEATYRDFLDTRAAAETVQDIFPYLPAEQISELNALPAETLEMMGRAVLNPPNADRLRTPGSDFTVESVTIDGVEAKLSLSASLVENGIRTELSETVEMIQEEDGWKVTDPTPGSWRVTGRLPETGLPSPASMEPGPGAADWPAVTVTDASQFKLVAELVLAARRAPNKLRWDPNGQYLAVGDNAMLEVYGVPDLDPLWNGRVSTSFDGGTIRPDGQLLVTKDSYRDPIAAYLMANAAEDAPEEEGFFQSLGLPAERDSTGEVVRFEVEKYHPTEDVVAIAISGETADAIAFHSSDGSQVAPDISATQPGWMAWSPDGAMLAWASSFGDMGKDLVVSAYPSGETLLTVGAPEIAPGRPFFGSDGEILFGLGGNGENNAVFAWEIGTGNLLSALPAVRFAAPGSSGRQVYSVRTGGMVVEAGLNDTVVIFDASTGEEVTALTAFPKPEDGFTSQISAIGVSPNGRYLAAVAEVDRENVLKIWEIGAAEE